MAAGSMWSFSVSGSQTLDFGVTGRPREDAWDLIAPPQHRENILPTPNASRGDAPHPDNPDAEREIEATTPPPTTGWRARQCDLDPIASFYGEAILPRTDVSRNHGVLVRVARGTFTFQNTTIRRIPDEA